MYFPSQTNTKSLVSKCYAVSVEKLIFEVQCSNPQRH